MLNPGSLCRSKEPIMRFGDEEKERLCRVIGSVPAERWRSADMPEYKVELVSAPVTAFRREADLVLLPAVDRFELA
jgi:hypothetical protein